MALKKNKYGADLSQIRDLALSAHPETIRDVPAFGKVYAFCHGLEKWNNHKKNPLTGEWHVPAGPPWDVDGHQCEDIYVRRYLNLLSVLFLPKYLLKIKKWIQTSYLEAFGGKNFSIKRFPKFLDWLWAMRSYLYLYDDYWGFVIDSFQSVKIDIAEEILSKKLGGEESSLALLKTKNSLYKKQYEEIYNSLSHEFIVNHLDKDNWRINSYMWVSKSDPTCFIIDESKHKFDLPTGWSEKKILTLLERWYYWVVDKRVEVKGLKPSKAEKWQI